MIKNEGVKTHFSESDLYHRTINLGNEISRHAGENWNKLVLAYKANNESLPFQDNQFDCYLANLSL
jgi:ubiquinone/menaquinone biosynthesis C-methylase UbiE